MKFTLSRRRQIINIGNDGEIKAYRVLSVTKEKKRQVEGRLEGSEGAVYRDGI